MEIEQRIDAPRGRRIGSLGVPAVGLLLLLATTGIVLATSVPTGTVETWSETVAMAEGARRSGGLRDLHRWTAEAVLILAFLHLFRVFLAGSYRPPRSGNWAIGVALLALLLLGHATGLALPGTREGFWALASLGLRSGSPAWPPGAVLVLHCLVVPAILAGLVAVHWRRARRDGARK